MPIDSIVHRTLLAALDRLMQDGELPAEAKLQLAYQRFRDLFGPGVLKTLNGERLLQWYDSSDATSLTYWLTYGKMNGATGIPEIAGRFGHIGSGGHYQRLRLFRGDEDGLWRTGRHPKSGRVISDAEATTIASGFRDQLLAGCDVFSQFAPDGSDATYAMLQQQLEKVAPDLVHRAWAHKYFHMLYSSVLDDFHTVKKQHEILQHLRQVPPTGPGVYRAAGRFVLVARELGVPMNHLAAALNNWERFA